MDETGWTNDDLLYYLNVFNEMIGAPPGMLLAMAMKESSYNPSTGYFRNVRNWLGAAGLMQLRPNAIADIKRAYGIDINPFDPVWSAYGAALMFDLNRRYIKYYAKVDPSWPALIVAYNGGWTAGKFYMLNGYAPSVEGRNYIAFVDNAMRSIG